MNDKHLAWIFIVSLWVVLATQVFLTLGNRAVGKVNQAYGRATNCFAATSPPKRTPEYVKQCYNKAEAATDTRIDRYGDGR
jgi:hypothetical protein